MDISKIKREKIIADFYDDLKAKKVRRVTEYEEVFADVLDKIYRYQPIDFTVIVSRLHSLSFHIKLTETITIFLEWEKNKNSILEISHKTDPEKGLITLQSLKEALSKIEKICMTKTPLN